MAPRRATSSRGRFSPYIRTAQRWAPRIASGVRFAQKVGRSFGSMTRTNTRLSGSAPSPITFQRDVSTVYRRRRMPYRKRKRWIGMKRRVQAVIDKRLGTNVLHLTDTTPLIRFNGTNSQSYYGGLTLMDLPVRTQVAQAVDRLQPSQPLIGTTGGRAKHVIVGQMNNLTIWNSSETGVAYIDLYYWRAKQNCPVSEFSDIENIWSIGFNTNTLNQPTTGGSTVIASDYGITPWANPGWRKFVQVYKKTRVRLPAGQSTELSLRRARNEYMGSFMLDDQLSLIRGKTEGIFVVWTGGPFIDGTGNAQRAQAQNLVFSRARTLYYKVLQSSVPTAGETTS